MSNNAYDLSMRPGNAQPDSPQATLDVTKYSQNAWVPNECASPYPGCAHIVSYRGEDRSTGPEHNHDGFDWNMNSGTPLKALADGEVIAKRSRAVSGCFSATQNELYVKHVVGPSTTSNYAEIYVAYYAHLNITSSPAVGSAVTAGQTIGTVSNSGCTGGVNHLHLAILKLSNTARDYRPTLDTTPGVYGAGAPDNSVARIDPYGWQASQAIPNVDPGGYVWYNTVLNGMGPGGSNRTGGGSLTSNLWKASNSPPRPCDKITTPWTVQTASGTTTIVNPSANCSH